MRGQIPILVALVTPASPGCLDQRIAYGAATADDGDFSDDGDSDGGEDESADEHPVPYYCEDAMGPGIQRCDPLPEAPPVDRQLCPGYLAPAEMLYEEGWLYWRNERTQSGTWASTILRQSVDGGAVQTLYSEAIIGEPVVTFAVWDGHAFMASVDAVYEGATGGEATPLLAASSRINALAADEGSVYAATSSGLLRYDREDGSVSELLSGEEVQRVAIGETYIVAAVGDPNSKLVRVERSGGEPEEIVADARVVRQLIIEGEQVYWRAAPGCGWEGGFDILEVSIDGGPITNVLLEGIGREMAIDHGAVFFLDAGMKHPGVHGATPGGCFAPLTQPGEPSTITAGDGYLWVAYVDGCIDGVGY